MASTGISTPNHGLNQWQGSDKLRREDFNSDNRKIDAALSNHNHNATDVNAGILAIARGGTGAGTIEAALTSLGIDQTRLFFRPMTSNLNYWLPDAANGTPGVFVGAGDNIVNAPGTGWFRYIGMAHTGTANWRTILAFDFHNDRVLMRRQASNNWGDWHEVLLGNRVENITLTPSIMESAGAIRLQRQAGARMSTLHINLDLPTIQSYPSPTVVANLPVGYRPTNAINFVGTGRSSGGMVVFRMRINTNGQVTFVDTVNIDRIVSNVNYLANLT